MTNVTINPIRSGGSGGRSPRPTRIDPLRVEDELIAGDAASVRVASART
jgi:hypothetical protein